jgi:hypothetical protein
MVLMCSVLAQCDEPDYHKSADYFPLREGFGWNYLFQIHYKYPDGVQETSTDTATCVVKGDTVLNGLRYAMVIDENGSIWKAIRKEGSKFYGMNHELYSGFSKEYLFLDEEATINTTWRHDKEASAYTEYKVTAVNTTRVVNGVTYDHVMEMEVTYYGPDIGTRNGARHYYAKGVGEIYSFYPAGTLSNYVDMSYSLLKLIP